MPLEDFIEQTKIKCNYFLLNFNYKTMRKFFLGAALVAASFGMAQSADAATVMDVDGVSTVLAISDYEGTYNGTMDQIKMRGEDYEPRAASYTLEMVF